MSKAGFTYTLVWAAVLGLFCGHGGPGGGGGANIRNTGPPNTFYPLSHSIRFVIDSHQ